MHRTSVQAYNRQDWEVAPEILANAMHRTSGTGAGSTETVGGRPSYSNMCLTLTATADSFGGAGACPRGSLHAVGKVLCMALARYSRAAAQQRDASRPLRLPVASRSVSSRSVASESLCIASSWLRAASSHGPIADTDRVQTRSSITWSASDPRAQADAGVRHNASGHRRGRPSCCKEEHRGHPESLRLLQCATAAPASIDHRPRLIDGTDLGGGARPGQCGLVVAGVDQVETPDGMVGGGGAADVAALANQLGLLAS